LTANGYIKIAVVMAGVSIVVLFVLVYRLLELPDSQVRSASVQPLPANASATAGAVNASPTGTSTAANSIIAVANAFPNVHSASGLSSPRVGVLSRGDRAEVIARSADSAWLEIRYPASPSGVGWVSADLMTITTPGAVPPVAPTP
jgi:hypothetical protein